MSELYVMTTITGRNLAKRFSGLYEKFDLTASVATLGIGTASSDVLDYLGLGGSEKAVMFHMITDEKWKTVKRHLQVDMRIDVPGTGIAFIVPVSSIGGKHTLNYLTSGLNFVKGDESTLKDTKYELLVTIANQGYTELVMNAARLVHASGGTLIHAKGTGSQRAEQFLGVHLVPEKEIVLIVARKDRKDTIMRSIIEHAGTHTKAGAIVFSLPVTDTAGMRMMEELEAISEEIDEEE
jgi:nitrogen regulatory protein PII